jgi:adenylate cyclase
VLPFSNISSDPGDEYFADGMTEELISTVGKVGGLSVIARTSAVRYKSSGKSVSEIGQELNVGAVLEGSVRKAGNRLRINVQLIETMSQAHRWSESYDRDLSDVFAIQSDIARHVADALKLQLLTEDQDRIQKKTTESLGAYTLYLKGRFYWNERNANSVKKAIQYFEKAIVEDSEFALAYVGLADCYLVLVDQGILQLNDALAKTRTPIARALKINDTLAEAHTSLANLLMLEWRWEDAEKEFKRAIELNPNYSTAHHWYSLLLGFKSRREQALDEIRVALRLDPVSPIVNVNFALALAHTGHQEESLEQFKRTLTLEPNFGLGHAHLGGVYLSMSKYDEGIAELWKSTELMGNQPWPKALLGYGYALKGDRKRAQELLTELEEASKSTFVPSELIGTVHFALGEKEKALSYMERAFEERSAGLAYIRDFLVYREIRADPRFNALLDKVMFKT